jgi:hypothetical protein
MINEKRDHIEAQILGPLRSNDCERILIHSWLKEYVNKVMDTMPDIKKEYEKLKVKGIIREHQEESK